MAAITFQIIWGLGYLHYEKQLHRDIKPGNILMVCSFFLLFSERFLHF
jgi:serine/threonine protein kinase